MYCVAIFILTTSLAIRADDAPKENPLAPAIDRAIPAVVKLYGEGVGREHGYGTGVLVSGDGKIVTAYSLLTASRRIRAVLADGRMFDATHVRFDEYRKLALLTIDAKDLPHLTPAPSDTLEVGDTVIAVGNWFKVAEAEEKVSVSRGVLSLKTHLSARRLSQEVQYEGPVLIYDAVTSNPGAPGGALLDIEGRFVGLIGRVVEAVNTNTRLNYAMPGEEVAAFLGNKPSAAVSSSRPVSASNAKPDLGIKLSTLGYRRTVAYVERVRPGSPAAAVGIRPDDLIVALDGRRTGDVDAFNEALARLVPGQVVQIILKRGNQILTVEVTVGEKP